MATVTVCQFRLCRAFMCSLRWYFLERTALHIGHRVFPAWTGLCCCKLYGWEKTLLQMLHLTVLMGHVLLVEFACSATTQTEFTQFIPLSGFKDYAEPSCAFSSYIFARVRRDKSDTECCPSALPCGGASCTGARTFCCTRDTSGSPRKNYCVWLLCRRPTPSSTRGKPSQLENNTTIRMGNSHLQDL